MNLEGKSPSQRAAIAVNLILEEKDRPGFAVDPLAIELAPTVGVSKTSITDAWRVRLRDPSLFARIESGEISVWKAEQIVSGKPPPTKLTRAQRAEQISMLAAEGYRSIQISEITGISEETVRYIARKFNIDLPDANIGRTRRIDANRVIESTVSGLEGYAMGVQTIIGADIKIDASQAECMAASIRESMKPIRQLCRKLEEISNGAS